MLRRLLRRRPFAPRAPVTTGNAFQVLPGGPAWFRALRAAIRTARREVLLESFIWDDDRTGRLFLADVAAAARRGVRVRIVVDGIGSLGLGARALRPLMRAGGGAGVFNPVGWIPRLGRLTRRNHRKLAVIDGRTAFIGGFGFRDAWAKPAPVGWWDVGVRVRGPVAAQFRTVIAGDWAACGGPALPAPPATAGRAGREALRLLPSAILRNHLLHQLRRELQTARERVWVCTTYFIPTLPMRHALRTAARRGADVRLLLPTPRRESFVFRFAGRRHYGSLLRAGVRIFEYQPSFLHAKYAVADGHWALIGSSNLDTWSGRYNLEADLEASSPGAVRALAARFLADQREAHEVTRDRWERRALWLLALERLFGRFDPWL